MKAAKKTTLNLEFAYARPIVTRAWERLEIILVGCGGTGSWLAPSLARLAKVLQDSGKQVSLLFVDGDQVEAANIPRQNFCEAEVGHNKATALALRYAVAWALPVVAAPFPLDPQRIELPHGATLQLVVGCVDNAAARKSISDMLSTHNGPAFNMGQYPPTWWLDCGNSRDCGQVLLGCASEEKQMKQAFDPETICRILPSPAMQRPELLEALPEEVEDTPLSCAQIAQANVQSLMVNQMVAAVAADYALRLVTGGLRRYATYLDLPTGTHKSFFTTSESVAKSIGKTESLFTVKKEKTRADNRTASAAR